MYAAGYWHHLIYRLLPVVAILGALYFAFSLYRARRFFRRLQKDGMPMPPHHPLLGHLGLMASILMKMPRDIMPTIVLGDQIRLRYPHLDRAFYLDNWPFAPPMLIVTSPDLMDQFTKEESLPKVAGLAGYMRPMSGGHDILTMEGQEWSRWRAVFQPSFTGRDLVRYVPGLVKTVGIFRDALLDHAARGEMFLLGPMTLKLAMDMAGKAIWNHEFNSQTSENIMVNAVVSQLGWLYFREFSWDKVNPARLFMHKYNAWKMNRYIRRVFPSGWWYETKAAALGGQGTKDKTAPSSVIGKAVETFLALSGRAVQDSKLLRDRFDRVLNSQMRFFLLAGYDTSGSTIVYVFHLLQRHPEMLARVRQELDQVLGVDVGAAPSSISEQPHLLNRVPYLTAVIKETLRLYPPGSTVRTGRAGFYLVDREEPGRDEHEHEKKAAFPARLPTEGCNLFANHHGLHHNPRYWTRPEEFLPERFLLSPDKTVSSEPPAAGVHHGHGDLRPAPGAWRPFERGQRLCIGQELAMTEIKLVCMLTLRELDVVDAYDEFDSDLGVVGLQPAITTVNGDRAYQITRGGGSHPSDWYPCRARLAAGHVEVPLHSLKS